MSKKDMTFEEAIRALESIATSLENENIDLDESLKLYEEGVKLVRYCNKLIESAERKIKVLSLTPDGELEEKDFSRSENSEG
jgi:exodeoxyribonuclease VII small subunit